MSTTGREPDARPAQPAGDESAQQPTVRLAGAGPTAHLPGNPVPAAPDAVSEPVGGEDRSPAESDPAVVVPPVPPPPGQAGDAPAATPSTTAPTPAPTPDAVSASGQPAAAHASDAPPGPTKPTSTNAPAAPGVGAAPYTTPSTGETSPGSPAWGAWTAPAAAAVIGASPAGGAVGAHLDTVVIEADVLPRRLRRPIDLLRFGFALVTSAVVLAISYFASSTTRGLESDLSEASTRIPGVILFAAALVGFIGVVGLPVVTAVDLVYRRRGRVLVDSLFGLASAVLITSALVWLITRYPNPQLLVALTGQETPGQVPPLNSILAGLVAFITVARLVERPRLGPTSIVVVVAIALANVLTGGITASAMALSILIGWMVGLIIRYTLGTPTTRPTGTEVAAALDAAGFPITVLRAQREISGGRLYVATTRSGSPLNVTVFDRDLEGAGVASNLWRTLRVRDDSTPSRLNMRRRVERNALQAYAAHAAGAPVPRLLVASQVGSDAALLAYPRIEGRVFADIGADLTDADLDSAWHALRTLHDSDITHRSLTAHHLLRDTTGHVWLLHPEDGAIAAGDIAERVDLAELLCTLAMLTDPDRAVASGRRVLGAPRLVQALGLLQPIALSTETRRSVRKRKDLIVQLRDVLLELSPSGEAEQVEIERVRPRAILTIVGGTVAGYILLTQLAQVDLVGLLREADLHWMVIAIVLSAITYLGAAMALDGFVPERLNFLRTLQAQLAASFATLVSPPTLGAVAVNVRYLQRSGVHPALAAASVGVSQVMAFAVHLLLLLGFGVVAGTQRESGFTPPSWVIAAIAVVLAASLLLLLLPPTRRWASARVRPVFQQVGPRLLTLLQQPGKLALGIGGILVLNLAYCLCLIACVWAFGGDASPAAIAFVYLAGSTIGQAAPTPGGLGAVEAALSAGLAAAGMPGGEAVSATLVFRLVTFWLPTIPGWFAFNNLQRNNAL